MDQRISLKKGGAGIENLHEDVEQFIDDEFMQKMKNRNSKNQKKTFLLKHDF